MTREAGHVSTGGKGILAPSREPMMWNSKVTTDRPTSAPLGSAATAAWHHVQNADHKQTHVDYDEGGHFYIHEVVKQLLQR